MDKLKFSLVTITYNSKAELPVTFQGIEKLKNRDFEYIVIDGGSTDGTVELLQNNEHIIDQWFSAADEGISDAFNKGIEKCRGEFIGLINAGDWYEPDALDRVWANSENADIICGSMKYWDSTRAHLRYQVKSNLGKLKKEMSLVHPATFVRRGCYRECGGYNKLYRYAMDYELLLRMFVAGKSIKIITEQLANMTDGGVSALSRNKGAREVLSAQQLHLGHSLGIYLHYFKEAAQFKALRLIKSSPLVVALPGLRKLVSRFRKDIHLYDQGKS